MTTTERAGKERKTWQTSTTSTTAASSLLNIPSSSLTKSINSAVGVPTTSHSQQHQARKVKRSVTPNARSSSSSAGVDVVVVKRSVTPVGRTSSNNDHDVGGGGRVPGKRSVTPLSRLPSIISHDPEPGRVRVAVRLRPRNAEDLASDADFADCVEIQPELKKLNLRKNNWNADSYKFDEVFTETASQKRVYEVVAKPVVESVLSGYNGTIMAYGQTGTGKTYTVGNLGKNDASERGIMVRAVEDIVANTAMGYDSVEVSYLQLYMESIQDLLAPEKVNIPIVEDAKTGEILLPGASVIPIGSLDHFMELLQSGESNRHAANTKLNTNSSRSHAILMVYVKRKAEPNKFSHGQGNGINGELDMSVSMIRKSKLLIVDLAGSERINKSGSEGQSLEEAKFINLSLTSLGKCINALAENSPHIPTRESKLTRILRDSFGGTARTSLIITVGPSARHHAETTSTIMFGQRAMKIVNMMRVKEEFDYESLSRKLESQVDHLTREVDRQQKLRDSYINEMEKKLKECQRSFVEAEKSLVGRCELLEKDNTRLEMQMKSLLDELNQQKDCNTLLHSEVARLEMSIEHYKQKQQESTTYQKTLVESTEMYEKQIAALINQLEDERAHYEAAERQMETLKALLSDHEIAMQQCQTETSGYLKELQDAKLTNEKTIGQLTKQLEDVQSRCEHAEKQVKSLEKLLNDQNADQEILSETIQLYEKKIADVSKQLQDELLKREEAAKETRSLREKLTEKSKNQSQEVQDLMMKLEEKDLLYKAAAAEAQTLKMENSSLISDKLQSQEVHDVMIKLQQKDLLYQAAAADVQTLKTENSSLLSEKEKHISEIDTLRARLQAEEKHRMMVEDELLKLKKLASENSEELEDKKLHEKVRMNRGSSSFRSAMGLNRSMSGQRVTIAKICEEVGLERILKLLSSEDVEVQMHALKVVANLAAEDINQEKIVNEGGLDALLTLIRTSQNTTILRVASGAVANLAMNETNQGMIMSKGGAQLLGETASKTDDPQTLRMIAGAIANLCGNVALHFALKEDGAIKALLSIARSSNADVIAQVARGLANFAKCETREVIQGHRSGRSLLMEDGVINWLIINSKITAESTRRHIELALCHLAQNEENARDFMSSGGLKEVIRISSESGREDIRNLARKTLKLNPMFTAHIHDR